VTFAAVTAVLLIVALGALSSRRLAPPRRTRCWRCGRADTGKPAKPLDDLVWGSEMRATDGPDASEPAKPLDDRPALR
jgi:hypothetical protein